jgi:hypothetical protein
LYQTVEKSSPEISVVSIVMKSGLTDQTLKIWPSQSRKSASTSCSLVTELCESIQFVRLIDLQIAKSHKVRFMPALAVNVAASSNAETHHVNHIGNWSWR